LGLKSENDDSLEANRLHMNLKKRKSAYELNLRYYYFWPKII